MQDVFIEYMVRRKNTPQITLKKLGIVLGATVVSALLLVFGGALGAFSFLSTLGAIGVIYGAYILLSAQNVEFEYSVTNGEIDIDRILAQRKRQRLVTVNCRQVEAFGKYKDSEHAQKTYGNRIFACDSKDSADLWYCVAHKEKGQTLVVFNASEKMLNGIKPFLPRPIMHEAFKVGQA